MERLRDDAYGCPLFKRLVYSSCGESYGESQVGEISDALCYLKEVEDTFPDQREKYVMFKDIMKDFKAERIYCVYGVIKRVVELFKGHPSLLLGFKYFLPKGYEIILNDEDGAPTKKIMDADQALNFLMNVKERFEDNHMYKSFLDIMLKYKRGDKDVKEVYHEVVVLFNDHPDLLDEFIEFVPDSVTANPLPNLNDDRTLMN